MKKILLSFLIFAGMFFILDYITYKLAFFLGESKWLYIVDFFFKSIFIFLLIMNFLYNNAFNLKSKKIFIAICIIIPLILSIFIADRLVAINKFYYYSKTLKKSTSGGFWQFDDSLSYKGRPYSKGTYNYYLGDTIEGSVPVIFDSLGFRTVPDSLNLRSDVTDLFLGCSFTFGDFIEAQNTYAYLTAKILNHAYINGAISGFGAGQMLQIAGKLLPKRKFKFVFIQLTDWLTFRAMQINGPTRFGYRPFPYFSDTDGTFTLNRPAYTTLMYTGRNWRKTTRSYFEKIHFSITDGFKIEIHDYYAYKFAQLKISLGLQPKPTKKRTDLETWFYDQMVDLCLKESAIPVFLKIQYPDSMCKQLVDHLRKRATVVDIDSSLHIVALQRGLKPGKLFRIYHSSNHDSIQFDAHPNKYAHSIYATTIVNNLKYP